MVRFCAVKKILCKNQKNGISSGICQGVDLNQVQMAPVMEFHR